MRLFISRVQKPRYKTLMCQIPVLSEEAQTSTPWQNQPSQMTAGNLTKRTNKWPRVSGSRPGTGPYRRGPWSPSLPLRSPPGWKAPDRDRIEACSETTRAEPLRPPAGVRRPRGRKAEAFSAPCAAQRPRAHAAHCQRDVGSRRCPPRWPRHTLRAATHSEINAGAPEATKTKLQPARPVGAPSASQSAHASRRLRPRGFWLECGGGAAQARGRPAALPPTAPVRCPPGGRLREPSTARATGPSPPPPRLRTGSLFSGLYLPGRRRSPNSHLPHRESGREDVLSRLTFPREFGAERLSTRPSKTPSLAKPSSEQWIVRVPTSSFPPLLLFFSL